MDLGPHLHPSHHTVCLGTILPSLLARGVFALGQLPPPRPLRPWWGMGGGPPCPALLWMGVDEAPGQACSESEGGGGVTGCAEGAAACESLGLPEGTPGLSPHLPDEPPRQCRYLWLVFTPQQVV